jgi:RimJ/RimL family protein N-acetyltransferase
MLGTKYDREMDALHPRTWEQEFMITERGGAPLGLIKFRPDRLPNVAWAWLHLRRETDYSSDAVRSGLRHLLRETAKGRGINKLFTPVGPKEDALAALLQAVGFQPTGALREALYLHGKYHDVRLFAYEAEGE